MKQCRVEGCCGKHVAKGYCGKHYQQIQLYGQMLERTRYTPNTITITGDIADIELYNIKHEITGATRINAQSVKIVRGHKCGLDGKGYVRISVNGKYQLLHRYLLGLSPDDPRVVDHIDHNKLNNTPENLRVCSPSQNNMNRKKALNNTSGFPGVVWHKPTSKWESQIKVNGKHIHLGLFADLHGAIKARKQAEIEYFGEYRHQGGGSQ